MTDEADVERVARAEPSALERKRFAAAGLMGYLTEIYELRAAIAAMPRAGVPEGWRPIETAPKDGTAILVYDPEGVYIDDHAYTWPKGAELHVVPARWHTPNQRTHDDAGWYVPWFGLSFGPYDDPSTDIDSIAVTPTHWQPLPAPPKNGEDRT